MSKTTSESTMTTPPRDHAALDSARAAAEARGATEHPTGARTIGRRSFLVGAGGLTLPLPFLEALAPKKAWAAPRTPRFYLLWHQGQGTQFNQWALPGASESAFTLGEILKPIAAYKDRMLFFRGIDNKVKELATGDGHSTAQSTVLTCQPNGGGPSFDQVLSQRIRKPGQRASLNLAAGGSARMRFYAGPGDKIESQGDPRKALASVFTSGGQSSNELAKLQARRKSVLDGVRGNMTSFRKRLGKEDAVRLDQHTEKLRELETRYMQQGAISCTSPTLKLPANFNPGINQAESAEAQIEIITMAFACNLTPVASLEFTDDHNPPMFGGLHGGYSDWHDMVHSGESKRGIAGLITGYKWYAERFAKLLERLSAVQADGAPLIDQTVVQWTCDFGYGAGHNGIGIHVALAGSLGANVKMGRLISFTNPEEVWGASKWSTNNLYVTLLRAFGQTDEMWGRAANGVQPGVIPGVLS